jgi:hypothetical protein
MLAVIFPILVGPVCLFLRYHYCYLPNTLPCCIVICPYVSLVYIVLFFGFKFKILQNMIKQRKSNIRFQEAPLLLRPKFILPKRERRPLIDPKEPMLPM